MFQQPDYACKTIYIAYCRKTLFFECVHVDCMDVAIVFDVRQPRAYFGPLAT